MKYLLLALFFTSFANAQTASGFTENLITDLSRPYGLAKKGNFLYYSELQSNKITKVDLINPGLKKTVLVNDPDLNTPAKLLIHNNFLYVSEYSTGQISRINLSNPNPYVEDFIKTGLKTPVDFIIKDNIMYIADFGNGRISKVDLTDDFLQVKTQTTLAFPYGITFKNDNLYISSLSGTTPGIYKHNLTDNTTIKVVDGLENNIQGRSLNIVNNTLFVSNFKKGNTIYKINLETYKTTTLDALLNNLDITSDILIDGTDMYIAQYGANKISKYTSSTTLSSHKETPKEQLKTFINNNILTLQTNNKINTGFIYNTNGKVVTKFTENSIDIKHLPKGIYIVKTIMNNGNMGQEKFVLQ